MFDVKRKKKKKLKLNFRIYPIAYDRFREEWMKS